MLVLTRKLNQQIQLGDNIKITVLRVKGNTIRLGIEAPRDVRVVRGELEPLPQESRSSDSVYTAVIEESGDAAGQGAAKARGPASQHLAAKLTSKEMDLGPGQIARSAPAGGDAQRGRSPLGAFLSAAGQTPAAQLSA